jgi:hypothetical protein
MLAKYASPIACHWFPHVRPVRLVEYVQSMIDDLETLTIRAGGLAFRRLANEIDDFC